MGSPAVALGEILELLERKGFEAESVSVSSGDGGFSVQGLKRRPAQAKPVAEELTPEQQRARWEDLQFASARAPT